MPVVNGKEFPYSKKGMKDASRSKKSMKEKLAEKEKDKKRKGK